MRSCSSLDAMASHAVRSAWSGSGEPQAGLALSRNRYTLAESGARTMNRDFVDQAERLAVVAIALAAQAAALLAEEEQEQGSGDNGSNCGSNAVPAFPASFARLQRTQRTARRGPSP